MTVLTLKLEYIIFTSQNILITLELFRVLILKTRLPSLIMPIYSTNKCLLPHSFDNRYLELFENLIALTEVNHHPSTVYFAHLSIGLLSFRFIETGLKNN